MKNILILEDHAPQREALSLIVGEVSNDIHLFAVGTLEEAYTTIFKNHIDIFMVDIIIYPHENGDTSGLQFVRKIREMEEYTFTPVIFTTTLDDPEMYAYKQLNCIEYIEKPYDIKRVKEVVKKCLDFPEYHIPAEREIIFREDGVLWPIRISEIFYIESNNHSIYVHRTNGEVDRFSYRTIKNISEDVKGSSLLQCNRSNLINKEYIRNVDLINGMIEMQNCKTKINIGITYKRKLREMFKLD